MKTRLLRPSWEREGPAGTLAHRLGSWHMGWDCGTWAGTVAHELEHAWSLHRT